LFAFDGETKDQDAYGRARLTIEIGAEFPVGPNAAVVAGRWFIIDLEFVAVEDSSASNCSGACPDGVVTWFDE
jgi:hypothetical protein